LPVVAGPVTVTFQTEDQAGGQDIGPVTVTDHDAYDRDPVVRDSRGQVGLPYGYQPAGVHDLGWSTSSTTG
jgi:hypothetical protein